MRKYLLIIGLLLPSIASAQGVGNVVLKHYPGNPSGGCSANQMALNDSNGDLSICHNGMWMDVGGGAGGGISGTVSSPFVPFASGPDALSDSLFQYNATSSEAPCNLIGSGPCFYADDTNDTVVLSSEGFGIVADGFGTVINIQPASISVGLNGFAGGQVNLNGGTTGAVRLQPGASDSSLTIKPGIVNLGVEGVSGGSLTLNDATMGSFALATDTANPFGSALEFTNVGVMGTGQLDMSVFPDDPNIDVTWSAPGTFTPAVGWFIGPTTVKTIADIVDVNTTTLNPDTTGFPCGPAGLGDGQIAHFSDGDTNVWGAALTGGGALFVEAYCDGNNWLVMGAAASTGPLSATTYSTATNCANGAAPAVCGSAAAGHVAVPTGATPTLVVNTSAVTATSEILLTVDESSTISGVTCNTTLSTLPAPVVTARTAATSFTIQVNATLLTYPACIGYSIVN